MIETTNQSGGILSRFAQGQNIDEPLAESTSGGTDYYEADGLGSITSLTNGVGTVAQTYTYDSFGNTTHSTGSLSNPFQYTAREFDTETGLYYYRARYYDPMTGRFRSEDRIRFWGGTNFYSYVVNDPTDLFDPLGLSPKRNVPFGWRDCNAEEEAFCLGQCDANGWIFISCKVAQTKRIKSLKHGPDWYDFDRPPSCYCEDPKECPNKSPQKRPQGGPLLPFILDWLIDDGWEWVLAGAGA